MRRKIAILLVWASLFSGQFIFSQIREYRIHDRGILHETVYNTGEIGQAYHPRGNEKTQTPLMEWPAHSATILKSIKYSGQHNSLGGGVYIAANEKGKPGKSSRFFAHCGGVGKGTIAQTTIGRWSFPISMEKIENFPVLEDGSLNYDYNPSEAEEIITAKWATNIGITVTRTSRAWSYPDFDDFIIYEYTFENTGDIDGNPSTIEQKRNYRDLLVCFMYTFGPSMYGFQRYYKEWRYNPGLIRGDTYGWWDRDYWLQYNQDRETLGDTLLGGKPEPDKELFLRFAQNGEQGGGLASPQAAGMCCLYYDTGHLAYIDSLENSEKTESEIVWWRGGWLKKEQFREGEDYAYLNEKHQIKQPWHMRQQQGNTHSDKIQSGSLLSVSDRRWGHQYGEGEEGETKYPVPEGESIWEGHGTYQWTYSHQTVTRNYVFGPYSLDFGETIEFTIAEVVGYGAEHGKIVEGGQSTQMYYPAQGWQGPVKVGDEVITENYIQDFGYPDYVNSDVRTIQDVARKAFEAYTGQSILHDLLWDKNNPLCWPENNPKDGVYVIPTPVPAPDLNVQNTDTGSVCLSWSRAVESFSHPQLSGALARFHVYRSESPIGSWVLLKVIAKGDVDPVDNLYKYLDGDPRFKIGETKFYAVVSVDEYGNESGKTNMTQFAKNIGPVTKLRSVHVVPNPFIVASGFAGIGRGSDDMIGFYGLPAQCTISIYSYAGQLIQTIEHNQPEYSLVWLHVTRNNQSLASGVYFFVVKTPEGEKTSGKFIVIK